MNFLGRRDQLYLFGIENTDAVEKVKEVAAKTELELISPWTDLYGINFRTDHYIFNAAGVPAFTMGLEGKFLTRNPDEIKVVREEYGNVYHRPQDEVYPWFSYDGVVQQLETAYNLGIHFANTEARPAFLEYNVYTPAMRMWER